MKIGILYIITGNYTVFWKEFYESCEKFLLPDAEKFYFVFTDANNIDYESENHNIIKIYQENLGWPDNTLKRYHIFLKHEKLYKDMDYLFFFNANLKILKLIKQSEFIPIDDNIIVTIHPGFFNKDNSLFTYENNSKSTAYIPRGQGKYYIAGGLNGGRKDIYIGVMKELKQNIDIDENNNICAIWHDESHLNAYIFHHNNFQLLSPAYLYPEGWHLPFEPIILIRDKKRYGGHELLRNGNIIDFCKDTKYLYIYGIGEKGINLYNKLKKMNISVNGFIISDDELKQDDNVLYLSELNSPCDQTKIIIATKLELQGEVRLHLKKVGYCNIFLAY